MSRKLFFHLNAFQVLRRCFYMRRPLKMENLFKDMILRFDNIFLYN
jgi:hypothetical protein